ncbi:UDP-3-O-acyl-N-acetylglucosamine deacetylase [candidate division KSB3 bacterium]|uniref:UDP-3-O-acyl-N-acetylglucosamine deacetylase n=1 Tax=candidate division KSB3 bacterium TaxID=2044937 RepID=A0A9D5Q7C2_9BACT|nr:UDP-3-O-acyl-N-acetylglucosamine deacetylase [candidate division KSB3 bacterium]MBD3326759.1 UDP-3-O-acyl-N-acetylglucosamine deacetylase [candidate division KSB3 bacterium]
MYVQNTIKTQVSCSGIGLHTGNQVTLTFKPAGIGTGLVFRRIDLENHPTVKVTSHHVGDTSYATTLGKGAVAIKTVEHVLSAIYALEVTNLLIEIDGNEAPVIDGSASCFVRMLLEAGIDRQAGANTSIQVQHPLEIRWKDSLISVEPYDGFKITYTIDFPNPFIGVQTKTLEMTPLTYMQEIAQARTFCLYEEVEHLWKMGLSKGGSLENAVVFAQEGILNESLRYDDEPVRHKILDLIGDLAFLGHPLFGHIKVYKGGHVLHTKFVQALLSQPESWIYAAEKGDVEGHSTPSLVPAQERTASSNHPMLV